MTPTFPSLSSLLVAFVTLMVIGFDDQKPGTAPAAWTIVTTDNSSPRWTVEQDETAPSAPMVLKQPGAASQPLCVKDNTAVKDGFVQVDFNTVAGKQAQVAGIVWRYRDPKNYYIVQADALADKVILSKVEDGNRTQLDIVEHQAVDGPKKHVQPNKWQKLRVEFVRNQFKVMLDGKKLLQMRDQTFAEAGQVGLATEADSVTLFDNLTFGRMK